MRVASCEDAAEAAARAAAYLTWPVLHAPQLPPMADRPDERTSGLLPLDTSAPGGAHEEAGSTGRRRPDSYAQT